MLKPVTGLLFIFLIAGCAKNTNISEKPSGDFFEMGSLKVLIVGSLVWEDSYNLPSFSKYHRKDAELAQTLKSLGVPDSNIIALYDEKTKLADIYAALDKIAASSNTNSRFLFYYAGHGFNGSGTYDKADIYFANYDIRYWHTEKTGFNINYLADNFSKKFKGRQFLFMADCCKSGGLINVAQKISETGAKAAAITSSEASDYSTGNWTFTQKLLEGLRGDGFINADNDGVVNFNELVAGIDVAMKYNERQKSTAGFFNWNKAEAVNKNASTHTVLKTKIFFNGEYVFAVKKNEFVQAQITGMMNDSFICRYYDYSDYEEWPVSAKNIKEPHLVSYPPGTEVNLLLQVPRKAQVLDMKDGFMLVQEKERNRVGWYTYEWLQLQPQQKIRVNTNNGWHNAIVLEQKDTSYFVTYKDGNFTGDEWTTVSHIKF